MRLYRIMLVEDEEEIRLGIIKKINWEENGFIIVGDAENGQEALEKAENLKPDVIMTDIRMPFMNGLELGKNLARIMPSTKIIIFSGSDDFEYAHQAIKINVIDYVLKPINSIELIEVLRRLKIQLDEEYEKKVNVDRLYKHYVESIPLIREQFLVGLIEGRISGKELNIQRELVSLELKSGYYAVACINVDNASIGNFVEDISLQNEISLIPIAVKQIVNDTMQNNCSFISFIYCGRVIIIADIKEENNVLEFINSINEICITSEKSIGLKTSAGIGHVCNSLSKLNHSYNTAQNALDYRIIIGTGKGIYIDDVEPDNSIKLQFDEQEERKLLNAIKIGCSEDIEKIIEELFKKCEDLLLPLNKYRIFIMEIMTSLLKVVQAYNLDINKIFGENFNCYSYLEKFDSIYEVKEWFVKIGANVNDLIKRERIHSSKVLIDKAREYVMENYSDCDISVEILSSHLHVSPTYFSTIFKRETEMSFVNFLTTVRLEKAVNLLNTTEDKTYIIAEKVGYPEANYFSYVFKKKYGVSPSKYRSN
ncbi:MAG: response regulator [Clostridium sp.]